MSHLLYELMEAAGEKNPLVRLTNEGAEVRNETGKKTCFQIHFLADKKAGGGELADPAERQSFSSS